MKITIDTKEDSHIDIKKVIGLLNHIVSGSDEPTYSNQPKNIFEDNSAFGEKPDQTPIETTASNSGGMFNMFNAADSTESSTPELSSEPATPEIEEEPEEEEKPNKPISIQLVEY